jgi:hypothetical protein
MQQNNITIVDVNALPVHLFVKTKKEAKKVACKAKVLEMPINKDEMAEPIACCL